VPSLPFVLYLYKMPQTRDETMTPSPQGWKYHMAFLAFVWVADAKKVCYAIATSPLPRQQQLLTLHSHSVLMPRPSRCSGAQSFV